MASFSQPNSRQNKQSDDLTNTQNLLRATLDASMDMIQVFEAVRDDLGAITDFVWRINNQASGKIYVYVVGKSLLQLQPGVIQEGIFEAFKQVVESGESQQYDKHFGKAVG